MDPDRNRRREAKLRGWMASRLTNSADAYARAELKTCSSGARPAQQPASLPSITTAGTLRTPYCFALDATSDLCMSWTTTSWEEPASLLTTSTVSLHVEQPALNTSIFFFVAIDRKSTRLNSSHVAISY